MIIVYLINFLKKTQKNVEIIKGLIRVVKTKKAKTIRVRILFILFF